MNPTNVYQLKITLADIEPPIWRRIQVSGATTLAGVWFSYVYDQGDSWTHEILVEGIGMPEQAFGSPVCLAGARACPPEDCGGPGGYEDLLAALRDPQHPEHADMVGWTGRRFDPEAFDPAAVNRKLRLLK